MRSSRNRAPLHRLRATLAVLPLLAGGLSGCSTVGALFGRTGTNTPDNAPTLKSLATRQVPVEKDKGVPVNEDQAIAAYRSFLDAAPNAPLRAQALRRLGDLSMDSADNKLADSKDAIGPDYKVAIARYQDYLKTYPNDPENDRILYQLARAREQGGELEVALKTLDQLVREFPKTRYRDEANFRRGELLFTLRDYPGAETAYGLVLASEDENPFDERALYMHGWSLFKQGRLEDSLNSFFGVLDLTIANHDEDQSLEDMTDLSRADRELVEDTFRVLSLSLENLKGEASIPPYMDTELRHSYEARVYQQLGALYLRQERIKDATDTYAAFVQRQPLHAQAPMMQARVIEIYEKTGFDTLALQAKKDFVGRYGLAGEYRAASPEAWEHAQPQVKTLLDELARRYHASAQKTKASADYQEAVKWYRAYLAAFPNDPDTAQNNFLLAELLYEDAHFAEAAVEYEKTAYDYPTHAKSADSGYAALLAYNEQDKRAPDAAAKEALQRAGVDSALRFGAAFPEDPRTGAVLTRTAETLYALKDGARASAVAQQVLALVPPAAPAQRRVAWTVVAYTAFEAGSFAPAEQAFREVLALAPANDAARPELTERLAASIYKQGEADRAAGRAREAADNFARVAIAAPDSPVRANAQFDAAAQLIVLKDWPAAAKTLEDFRTRFPKHPLQAEVPAKLALIYGEQGQWALAAAELERIADTSKDAALVRGARWQVAELHEKAIAQGGARALAVKAYERYLKLYPEPLEAAVESRARLSRLAHDDGNAAREFALQREIFQADQAGGAARTPRTRTLGAQAALALATPVAEAYRKIALVEPLQKSLKAKKAKMEETLKAYAVAADYGVADVTTAATFHTATVYQDFGKALLASERPKKLSKAEREQYDVLLEEQAFPFEEKATELHEINARRAASGLYDEWVKKSFAALRELRPVRYGKTERSEVVIDAIR